MILTNTQVVRNFTFVNCIVCDAANMNLSLNQSEKENYFLNLSLTDQNYTQKPINSTDDNGQDSFCVNYVFFHYSIVIPIIAILGELRLSASELSPACNI